MHPSTLQASERQEPRGGSSKRLNPRGARVRFKLPLRTSTSYIKTIDRSACAQSARYGSPIVDHCRSASLPVGPGTWRGPWGMTSMRGQRQRGRWASDISLYAKTSPNYGPAGCGVKRWPSEERATRSETSSYTAAPASTPPISANSTPPGHRSARRGCSSSSTRLRSSGPCIRTSTPRGSGGWCRRFPDS